MTQPNVNTDANLRDILVSQMRLFLEDLTGAGSCREPGPGEDAFGPLADIIGTRAWDPCCALLNATDRLYLLLVLGWKRKPQPQ